MKTMKFEYSVMMSMFITGLILIGCDKQVPDYTMMDVSG